MKLVIIGVSLISFLFVYPQAEVFKRQTRSRRQKEVNQAKSMTQTKVIHRPLTEYAIHESVPALGGKSRLFDALRNYKSTKNPLELKNLWYKEGLSNPNLSTSQVVQHLYDLDHDRTALSELYPGKTYDEQRALLMQAVADTSFHLAREYRNAFIDKGNIKIVDQPVRTDDTYGTLLFHRPTEIYASSNYHTKNPLEVAVDGKSSAMALQVLQASVLHGVSDMQLAEPLIDTLKKIYKQQGDDAAIKYLEKIKDTLNIGQSTAFLANRKTFANNGQDILNLAQKVRDTFVDYVETIMGA